MAKYTKINLLIRSLRIFDSRAWPSGKAPGFGPGIRGFESLRPSHDRTGQKSGFFVAREMEVISQSTIAYFNKMCYYV